MQVRDYLRTAILFTIFALLWSAGAIMIIVNLKYVPPTTSVFIQFAAASIFMAVFFSRISYNAARQIIKDFLEKPAISSDGVVLALAGLTLSLAFFLQVIKRYAYAPSGADIVFLLALTPLFVVIITWAIKMDALSLGKLAGSAAALLGTIAIVGNWEKPSSFSPFSVFPVEETVFVVSALSLALFIVAAKKLIEKHSPSVVTTLTLWIGTPILFALMLIEDSPAIIAEVSWAGWAIVGFSGLIGLALPILLFLDLLREVSVTRASTAIYLSPILITFMIGIEKGLGLAVLPTPFMWLPILVGGVIVILGVVAAWSG